MSKRVVNKMFLQTSFLFFAPPSIVPQETARAEQEARLVKLQEEQEKQWADLREEVVGQLRALKVRSS